MTVHFWTASHVRYVRQLGVEANVVSKCVLIVDDSGTVRTLTRVFVESQAGVKVCGEAVDGFEALEKARCLSPDLIILDLRMPRMNGLQAARELRTMMVHAPIILFTMYCDEVRPQDAIAAGVSAVVSKTDLFALQEQIKSLLAN
jgi:DNA-binding NarL/FixJ family response regulator